MSAKIKDPFPPTSSSIQLLARQRRGAAAAQNGNKTFDVVSQQDLEQISNILKPCSDRKSRQGIPETFSVDLDEREYDRYPVQCGAGRYQGCSGWLVGAHCPVSQCETWRPGHISLQTAIRAIVDCPHQQY